MTDAELTALAALVNMEAVVIQAANDDRSYRGEAMAYSGFGDISSNERLLREELQRRGIQVR